MLTVEDRFMINDLYRAGVSVSDIARRTGHDRKTVRRSLATPVLAPPRPRPPRACKIDPYVPYLEQRLAVGVFNARKLCAELQQRGYPGRESQVRAWVQCRRPPAPPAATLRFETLPGEQAQCDWGHFGAIRAAGVQRRLYGFVMTLGFSRVMYLEFTRSLDMAWWLRCHQHAFAYFGRVPRTVLHDNLKSAVLGRDPDGTIRWNPRYLDFAAHVGFTPRACAPYRPQTKGKVENGVGYVRRNFWVGLEFVDLADLNDQSVAWLDGTANQRRHGTTGVVPFSRLADEQLAPYRGVPYDTSVLVTRRSSRDCLVSNDGNLYSVPAAYAGQVLLLKATAAAEVVVLTLQETEVARHPVAAGHGQRVIVAALGAAGGRWRRWEGEEVAILFQAHLPAGGYTSVQVSAGPGDAVSQQGAAPEAADPRVTGGANWLENWFVRVDVAADGTFTLLDRVSGREYGPLLWFRSEADRGDEYSFCPVAGDRTVESRGGQARVALVANGPLRATLEIRTTLEVPRALAADRSHRSAQTLPLPICSRVSLGTGRRVEVQTELENTARDHRLRVLFATGVQTDVADAQGQFQVMRRPVALPAAERARVPEFDEEQEVSYHPQRAFVDVSDERGGLAVLNGGLPEYEAEPGKHGVTLGLTLLRAVGWLRRDDLTTRYKHAGPPLETPDAQCLGVHRFEYALLPHDGDWLVGGVAAEAESYTSPVYSAVLDAAPGQAASLPARQSFYSLSPRELLFSACKRSDDGQALLVRAYNTAPYPVEGVLHLTLAGAVRQANLAEREWSEPLVAAVPQSSTSGAGQLDRFPVRANEIVTLAIRLDEATQ